jgi:hypothetical protein
VRFTAAEARREVSEGLRHRAHRCQGLFAKRRIGKSEFLEKDLLPAARKQGYLTAYVNLWDARKHPAPALIAALITRSSWLRLYESELLCDHGVEHSRRKKPG